jgi:hypothetical protein
MSQSLSEKDHQKISQIARVLAPRVVQFAQAVGNAVLLANADSDITDEIRDIEVMIIDGLTTIMESDEF